MFLFLRQWLFGEALNHTSVEHVFDLTAQVIQAFDRRLKIGLHPHLNPESKVFIRKRCP